MPCGHFKPFTCQAECAKLAVSTEDAVELPSNVTCPARGMHLAATLAACSCCKQAEGSMLACRAWTQAPGRPQQRGRAAELPHPGGAVCDHALAAGQPLLWA